MEVSIGDESSFTLNFANNQVILAADEADIDYMLRKLHEEYKNGAHNKSFKTRIPVSYTHLYFV